MGVRVMIEGQEGVMHTDLDAVALIGREVVPAAAEL